jgi:transposase
MRLIYVLQQETELPLFMRYCPGNVVDVNTLTKTILELKANGIKTKFAILDAGYLTKENIEELYENGISFLSRLKENNRLYKDVLSEHLPALEVKENLVSYNSRYAYIKRVDCDMGEGHRAYVYLCRDLAMKSIENSKLFDKAGKVGMKTQAVFDAMERHGIFALVSSRPIAKDKVLGTYYTRQQIEQVFDICKSYTNMLPLRVQTEETLRGHLMLSFIAAVIVKMLQKQIMGTPYSPIDVFTNLRNHKCKVFDDFLLTQESVKKANDIYKLMDLKVPHQIPIHKEAL